MSCHAATPSETRRFPPEHPFPRRWRTAARREPTQQWLSVLLLVQPPSRGSPCPPAPAYARTRPPVPDRRCHPGTVWAHPSEPAGSRPVRPCAACQGLPPAGPRRAGESGLAPRPGQGAAGAAVLLRAHRTGLPAGNASAGHADPGRAPLLTPRAQLGGPRRPAQAQARSSGPQLA